MALLAYEAKVEVHDRRIRPVVELYDGTDPHHDHQLEDGDVLTGVALPPPVEGERGAYFRATSRAYSEWPLVECVVRLEVEEGEIRFARVAVGGVASVPLRLSRVEEALAGQLAGAGTFERAADVAAEGANPLPTTGYKVSLVQGTVLETLERALRGVLAT
jgi:xanthine dehydrogenase YagS FAD-binding subunit